MLNDTLAEWCGDKADRFAWIGSVPLAQPETAARELERIVAMGGCGVIIPANIENINLGELPLDPFWRTAEVLGLPVLNLSSPGRNGAAWAKFGSPRSRNMLRYHAWRRLAADDRCAGSVSAAPARSLAPAAAPIRIWPGVSTSCIAAWTGRHRATSPRRCRLPTRRRWPMTASSMPPALRFLIDLVGLDNVALGTDYSFPPADMEPLALLRLAGLSSADVRAIADDNPRRLFARLGAR